MTTYPKESNLIHRIALLAVLAARISVIIARYQSASANAACRTSPPLPLFAY